MANTGKIKTAQWLDSNNDLFPKADGGLLDADQKESADYILRNGTNPVYALKQIAGYREAWSFYANADHSGEPFRIAVLSRSKEAN